MQLADWLYQNSMTPSLLRRKLGVKNRATVHRWLTGERRPSAPMIQKIIELTRGEVQLADFLDPSPPRCARVIVDDDGNERRILPWSPDWEKHEESDLAEPTETPDRPEPIHALASPIRRALDILGGRAKFTSAGTFLLDGRATDLRGIVRAANEILKRRGSATIPYPGVEPLDE